MKIEGLNINHPYRIYNQDPDAVHPLGKKARKEKIDEQNQINLIAGALLPKDRVPVPARFRSEFGNRTSLMKGEPGYEKCVRLYTQDLTCQPVKQDIQLDLKKWRDLYLQLMKQGRQSRN